MQTKVSSFIEACINTAIGFVITLVASPIIYWACGVPIALKQMTFVTLLFTIISVVSSYLIRRYFNQVINKAANAAANKL